MDVFALVLGRQNFERKRRFFLGKVRSRGLPLPATALKCQFDRQSNLGRLNLKQICNGFWHAIFRGVLDSNRVEGIVKTMAIVHILMRQPALIDPKITTGKTGTSKTMTSFLRHSVTQAAKLHIIFLQLSSRAVDSLAMVGDSFILRRSQVSPCARRPDDGEGLALEKRRIG